MRELQSSQKSSTAGLPQGCSPWPCLVLVQMHFFMRFLEILPRSLSGRDEAARVAIELDFALGRAEVVHPAFLLCL
jgi:hypothetical protein